MRLLEAHLTQEACKARVRTQAVKYWFHGNECDFGIARLQSLLQPDYGPIVVADRGAVNRKIVRVASLLACHLLIQFDSFSPESLFNPPISFAAFKAASRSGVAPPVSSANRISSAASLSLPCAA